MPWCSKSNCVIRNPVKVAGPSNNDGWDYIAYISYITKQRNTTAVGRITRCTAQNWKSPQQQSHTGQQ